MFFSPYLYADTFYGSAHISHKKEKDLKIMGEGSVKSSYIQNLSSMGNLTLTDSHVDELKAQGDSDIKNSKIKHLKGQGNTSIKNSDIQEASTSGDIAIDTSSIQKTLKVEGYAQINKSKIQEVQYKGRKIKISGSHIHQLTIKQNSKDMNCPIEVILSNNTHIDSLTLEDSNTKITQDKTSKIITQKSC